MIKVGKVKKYIQKEDKKSGKLKKVPVLFTYDDVEFDQNEWAESKKFLPEDFVVVYMKREGKKSIPGWVSGSSWYGLRLKSSDQIHYWKRIPEENQS